MSQYELTVNICWKKTVFYALWPIRATPHLEGRRAEHLGEASRPASWTLDTLKSVSLREKGLNMAKSSKTAPPLDSSPI